MAIPSFFKRKIFYIPAILIVLAGGAFLAFRNGGVPSFETTIVERGDVSRIVNESGTVAPADEVVLAFTTSGRIASVPVSRGANVSAGQTLVRLDSAQAQAALSAALARASTAGGATTQTVQHHDQMVENARIALLTGDLQAYLFDSTVEGSGQSYQPPFITGTYSCAQEGEYGIELYPSGAPSGYSFRVSGLENLQAGMASASQPEPIGSCGLFIQFPENFVRGGGITWVVPVPNTRSTSYVSRLGAYQSALEARELARLEGGNAPVYAAEVEQARVNLANMTLTAPFSGIVTELSATPGQIASPGTPMLSLISAARYEITVLIPEDDIVGIAVGDLAEVRFDAFRDAVLPAEVIYVAPAASAAAGFVSFEVVLQFTEEDERIRSGLTADVDIFAESREDVLVVPVRAVIEEDGRRYVRVLEGEMSYRRVPVSVGLRGSGLYEITGGLSGGERIITFANATALSALNEIE